MALQRHCDYSTAPAQCGVGTDHNTGGQAPSFGLLGDSSYESPHHFMCTEPFGDCAYSVWDVSSAQRGRSIMEEPDQ